MLDILLDSIPKSVNRLMTARAQNKILLVHKQQDSWVEIAPFLSVYVVMDKL